MDSENNNQKAKFWEDDEEYRVFCNVCDKLCIERLLIIILKSSTHITHNI